MKITCISDIHGQLHDIKSDGDILVISGDICPVFNHNESFQSSWLETNFLNWLKGLDYKHKMFIFGNHDLIGENESFVNKFKSILPHDIHLLNDSSIEIDGIKFYGTPWTPQFFNWAFMMEDELLTEKFNQIPYDTNVLLTHGPPHGILDTVNEVIHHPKHGTKEIDNISLGSKSLRTRVDTLPHLKLHVFGHIHSGHGFVPKNGCMFVNASILGETYKKNYECMTIDIG